METIVRQAVTRQDIGKALPDSFQLIGCIRHEIGNGVRQVVNHIIVRGAYLAQVATAVLSRLTVFERRIQTSRLRRPNLPSLIVIKTLLITERAPGIRH